MILTDRDVARLTRLQNEIEKETHGKCRGHFIANRTRQVRLILKQATRREQELQAKLKREGQQLSLF